MAQTLTPGPTVPILKRFLTIASVKITVEGINEMRSKMTARVLTLCVMGAPSITAAGDGLLRADVIRPQASIWNAEDREIVMYRIGFGLHIFNGGKQIVNVGSTPVIVVAIQHSEHGTWVDLDQKSWYDDGTIAYAECSPLAPGHALNLTDVITELTVMRKRLDELGTRPKLRFRIEMLCKRSDAVSTVTQVVRTEPVVIELPQAASSK